MPTENIEETLTRIALKVAKSGQGCIFVIMNTAFDYTTLIEQDIKQFSVTDNMRRVETLSRVDGACIISPEGNLIAYSAHILNVKTFPGFGTRHASAYTASLHDNISILASEEDSKVRIFKDGKLLMELDPYSKGITEDKSIKEVTNILESVGVGALTAVGAVTLVPTIGITLVPGIVVFASAHYAFKFIGQILGSKK